jgi:Phytanoyl-CoA dioxygenase (PhyH)
VPVRFPGPEDPDDAIWHFDAGYAVEGQWRVRLDSRDRGLLALFLFSDVHADGAPTRLRPGSHLRVPRLLAGGGAEGCEWRPVARAAATATSDLPVELAVGAAGDVFLCHPFLVHAATWPHRGTEPRIMAQPAIGLLAPFPLSCPADDPTADVSPVERAILLGLAGAPARPASAGLSGPELSPRRCTQGRTGG